MGLNRQAPIVVGDVFDGRYQILRDLGRGAAGDVYEARHMFTGRFVAVKMVRPGALGKPSDLRARLQREGQALAAIRHPGVVDILDGGFAPDGAPYIVMEMLEGRTLEGLLVARGRISVANTAGLALQLCDALEAVHKAGVVHRDVKPSNVIVLRDPSGSERIKLVDFGIAQVANPSEEKLTAPGAVIGTPAYMSPEQLMGADDVDHMSDVYSVGVTMFECLLGAVPYAGSYPQVLMRATSADSSPKVRSRASGETIPLALAEVVDKAIAKSRTIRFQSAAELGAAIVAAVPTASRATTLLGPPPFRASAATGAGTQRRRTARAPYNTPVRLVLQSGGVLDGRTEDISESGALIITRAVCANAQRVGVRFALPMEGKVVSVEADVRWVRLTDESNLEGLRAIGLEFVEPGPAVRASIGRYVELMSEQRQT